MERRQRGADKPYIAVLVIDPRDGKTIYAAGTDGVCKTSDGARTWSPSEIGRGMEALAIAPSDPDILYAGGRSYAGGSILFKSVNGGRTWRRIPSRGAPIRSIAVDPNAPRIVYVGGGDFN